MIVGIGAVIKLSFARRPGTALLYLPPKRPHPTFVETTLPQLAGGKGASLPHNAYFMWCQDLAIASCGSTIEAAISEVGLTRRISTLEEVHKKTSLRAGGPGRVLGS